jgi:glutathione S-transferase
MIKLYYFYPSCALASHVALEESGLEYDAVSLDLSSPQQKEFLLSINEKGKVPTAIFDNEVLTENPAILWHIATLSPDSGLLPDDPVLRAKCLSLLCWYASTVHVAFRAGFRPDKIADNPDAHESIRMKGRSDFWNALRHLDEQYCEKEFALGDSFTVADTYPIVFYLWALIAEYPVEELKNLTAFKNRIIEKPSVKRVLEMVGDNKLTQNSDEELRLNTIK